MAIAILGIDLGKNSCSVVGQDATGRVVLRRRMRRETVMTFGAMLRDCQEFRVRAAIVDPKEVPDGTTQSTPHP